MAKKLSQPQMELLEDVIYYGGVMTVDDDSVRTAKALQNKGYGALLRDNMFAITDRGYTQIQDLDIELRLHP